LARSFLNGQIDRASFIRRAAVLGLAVSGAGSLASVAAAASGGTLQAALTGEPDMLDPTRSQIYTGAQVYDNVFSKLIDIDENQKFYGVLAKSWKQVDPKTWVFDLVSGVKFHNGDAFTANDVKYTFARIANPKIASGYAPLYTAIKSIEVNSPTRVTFHLSTPFGPFLTNLANNGEIVNKRSVEAKGSERKPVGTGPFQFVEWKQGDHITLKKFPGYFKARQVALDGVVFRFLLVDQGRIDALHSGQLDWVDAVPLQQLNTLAHDPQLTLLRSKLAGIPDYLALNVRTAPFDNLALRQAVAYAVDREEIRQVAYYGAGEDGFLEVPTGSVWYAAGDIPVPKPDLAKAKAKMKQAGLSKGVKVSYLGLPQYPELLKTGEVLKDQLSKIGIDMSIQQVDVSVWFDHFSKGTFQITSAYQERTLDPDNFYSLVLESGAAINSSGYKNPAVDKLIQQAAATTNMAKRKALYSKVRKLALGEAPIIFTHYETINYAMRKNITGSTINPTLELRLANVKRT
ncbi:MAG: ABC transporter substrate-binding protein, partial [Gaiellales bacterium]